MAVDDVGCVGFVQLALIAGLYAGLYARDGRLTEIQDAEGFGVLHAELLSFSSGVFAQELLEEADAFA